MNARAPRLVRSSAGYARFAVTTALVGLGCTAESKRAAPSVERDSAGIQIVESRVPAWRDGEAWTVSATPTVEIGSADGEAAAQLFQVGAIRRLANGRIVVANAGVNELRIYSADGRHLRTIGREGRGPGEFRHPSRFWMLAGDSILVVDLDRTSVFDSAGRFVRAEPYGGAQPHGQFRDGSYLRLVFAPGVNPGALGAQRPPIALVRSVHFGSEAPDTVVTLPGTDVYRISPEGSYIASYSLPFGRQRLVAVHDSVIYTADGSAFEIWEFTQQGQPIRIMRRAAELVPVSTHAIATYEQTMLGAARNDQQRQIWQQLFREWNYPDFQPFFDQIVVDQLGNVWTRQFQVAQTESSSWTVFDRSGRWLGEIIVPAALAIREIGDDYVLGLWKDSLDVEYVRVHRLRK